MTEAYTFEKDGNKITGVHLNRQLTADDKKSLLTELIAANGQNDETMTLFGRTVRASKDFQAAPSVAAPTAPAAEVKETANYIYHKATATSRSGIEFKVPVTKEILDALPPEIINNVEIIDLPIPSDGKIEITSEMNIERFKNLQIISVAAHPVVRLERNANYSYYEDIINSKGKLNCNVQLTKELIDSLPREILDNTTTIDLAVPSNVETDGSRQIEFTSEMNMSRFKKLETLTILGIEFLDVKGGWPKAEEKTKEDAPSAQPPSGTKDGKDEGASVGLDEGVRKLAESSVSGLNIQFAHSAKGAVRPNLADIKAKEADLVHA